jgi:hypothetical protein
MSLQAFYGVKVRLVNPDGNDEIEIQGYNTGSKVTAKELEKEMRKHARARKKISLCRDGFSSVRSNGFTGACPHSKQRYACQ